MKTNIETPRLPLPDNIREVFAKAVCLYTREQVEAALDQMATEIDQVVAAEYPVFLCVVIGGMIPLSSLLLRLSFPLEVDYVHATRYRGETKGKDLHWRAEPNTNLQGRTIVIVDDILDSGLTLKAVVDYCQQKGAKQIYTAVLVDKPEARQKDGLQVADFTGLEVPDEYVFGYGLDYKEYLRNAPGIYAVAKEHV